MNKVVDYVVSRYFMETVAERLHLSRFLVLEDRERSTSFEKGRQTRLITETFEALIGAIYFDQGIEAARVFLEQHVLKEEILGDLIETQGHSNPVSILNNNFGKLRRSLPRYRVIDGGDGIRPVWVSCIVDGKEITQGSGIDKRAAKRDAARKAIEILKTEKKSYS